MTERQAGEGPGQAATKVNVSVSTRVGARPKKGGGQPPREEQPREEIALQANLCHMVQPHEGGKGAVQACAHGIQPPPGQPQRVQVLDGRLPTAWDILQYREMSRNRLGLTASTACALWSEEWAASST